MNPLAAAYYQNGEPAYDELTMIFGFKKMKELKGHTVINISDSPLTTHDGETQIVHVTPARRKLFDEDDIPWDMQSSNEKVDHFYEVSPGGELVRQQKTVMSSRPLPKPSLPLSSPNGSFSASYSPPMWWRAQNK